MTLAAFIAAVERAFWEAWGSCDPIKPRWTRARHHASFEVRRSDVRNGRTREAKIKAVELARRCHQRADSGSPPRFRAELTAGKRVTFIAELP